MAGWDLTTLHCLSKQLNRHADKQFFIIIYLCQSLSLSTYAYIVQLVGLFMYVNDEIYGYRTINTMLEKALHFLSKKVYPCFLKCFKFWCPARHSFFALFFSFSSQLWYIIHSWRFGSTAYFLQLDVWASPKAMWRPGFRTRGFRIHQPVMYLATPHLAWTLGYNEFDFF